MTNITMTIVAIISQTPLWVWGAFAVVVILGYQRSRDRVVPLWRMILLPFAMIVLAVSGMFGAGLAALPAILVGLIIGGVSGWMLERDGAARRLPAGRLWLRGEWWSLLQISLIFAFRYSTAVASAMNPALATGIVFHLATLFVSSLLSAMILGRTLALLRVYFTSAPSLA